MSNLETRLVDLITRSPKLTDRRIREELDVDQDELHAIANSLRGKLGLQPGASLRDRLRRPAGAAS